MRIQGSQNSPTSGDAKCQVTSIDNHTCIDKSESWTCIENRVVSIQEQVNMKQVILSRGTHGIIRQEQEIGGNEYKWQNMMQAAIMK